LYNKIGTQEDGKDETAGKSRNAKAGDRASVLNQNEGRTSTPNQIQCTVLEEPVLPFLISQVRSVIEALKVGKVFGPDKIDNTFIKTSEEILIKHLVSLGNKILETSKIPMQWETAEIRLIQKMGGRCELDNFNHQPNCKPG